MNPTLAPLTTNALYVVRSLEDLDDADLTRAWDWALSSFLEARRRAGAISTAEAYARDIRLFFRWAAVRPWQVSAVLAQAYAVHLRDLGRAPATVNRKLAALAGFYRHVQDRFLFSADGRDVSLWPVERGNPFDAVERARVSPFDRACYPTTDELRALLAAADLGSPAGLRDRALYFTLASTCLRAAAVLGARWGDLQERPDGEYNLAYRYKGGQARRAVLHRLAHAYITDYLHAAGRLPAAPEGGPEAIALSDAIFVATEPALAARFPHIDPDELDAGRPLSNACANRRLKALGRRAGVDPAKCHLHGLRHAGARLRVELAREGGRAVDLDELRTLLGHRSLAITEVYVRTVLADPEDPALADVARALRPNRSEETQ